MKKYLPIVIVVAFVVAGGIAWAMTRPDDKPEQTNNTSSETTDSASTGDSQNTTENPTDNKGTTDGDTPVSNASEVAIENFAFAPATTTVKKGTTVTWTNNDSAAHTVTPDQNSPDFKGSQMLNQGDKYVFTFNKAGTYKYHCTPHPQMTATVVVTD